MKPINKVFIARSLDGYIADRKGGLDWLNMVPNPENKDLGYENFISEIDAIVMGRVTFETVCSFDMDWPYDKPVFVLSKTLGTVPEKYQGKVEIVNDNIPGILNQIHTKGHTRLYIDGGTTIQSFLREDLIDELIITSIPILLGGGYPLFGELSVELEFEHIKSELFLDTIVQDRYRRKR